MHKKIVTKAAKQVGKDAAKYKSKARKEKGVDKKHDLIEAQEAKKASKVMGKMAKKFHEY